jgi:hypothetical protein
VSARLFHNRPLVAAYLAMLAVATFGFWGVVCVKLPENAPGPPIGSEPWLEDPIPAVRTDHATLHLDRTQPRVAPNRRNPFMTAREAWFFGPAAGHAPDAGAPPAVAPWPALQAIVQIGGERAAILDAGIARAGDRIGEFDVIQVEDNCVLVSGKEGLHWLDLLNKSEPRNLEGK